MSYPRLKRVAVDAVDKLTNLEIHAGYGRTFDASTQLDDIEVTAPVRTIMPKTFNQSFRAVYGSRWNPVSAEDTGACSTIGDVILLAARQAGETVPPGEPK